MKAAKRIILVAASIVFCVVIITVILLNSCANKWYESIQTSIEENQWAVSPGEWDMLTSCHSGLYIAGKNVDAATDSRHIVSLNGSILYSVSIPLNERKEPINRLVALENGMFRLEEGDKYTYLYGGEIEIEKSLIYDNQDFFSPSEERALILAGSMFNYGYRNRQNVWFFEPEYWLATNFWNGYAVVTEENVSSDGWSSKYIVTLGGGEVPVSSGNWTFDSEIFDGLLLVHFYNPARDTTRYNYLNVINNSLISKQNFDDARDFAEGYASVKRDGQWGYIDTKGDFIIEPQYSEVFEFSDGLACVVGDDESAFLINTQNEQISKAFNPGIWAGDHHNGLFVWRGKNNLYNLYDLSFNRMLPKEGFSYLEYSDGVWIAGSHEYSAGVYLPACKKYIKGDSVPQIYSNAVVVECNNKSTMYDKHSGEVICKYDFIGEFCEGLAVVRKGRLGGFIDIKGTLHTDLQYFESQEFCNTLSKTSFSTGEVGLLINPLIYSEWSSDENERASMLGLTVTESENVLTYDELWRRIAELSNLIYDKRMLFGTEDTEKYNVDVAVLRKTLEDSGFPKDGIVDRQHLAVLLANLSSAYGKTTEAYVEFYEDGDLIASECRPSVAYISSLCLFDPANPCVHPEMYVMSNEISVYLLRYFERTL